MQNIRRLFPLITIVIIIIGLIACGSSATNTGTNAGTASTTVPGNTPTPATQHFKVGQTVNYPRLKAGGLCLGSIATLHTEAFVQL